jgi:hypothetical protein
MISRPMEERDIPAIEAIHAQAGYKFPLPDLRSEMIEGVEVIVDDSDTPVMAAAAKRGVEIYLFCPQGGPLHPTVKMEAVRMLHESLRDILVTKGFNEGYAWVPPEIESSWGRKLRRFFGWEKAWSSYRILDWKGGR